MPTASANVPIWWRKIVGTTATEHEIRALAKAVDAAGISRNDKNNVEQIWFRMRGARIAARAQSLFEDLR